MADIEIIPEEHVTVLEMSGTGPTGPKGATGTGIAQIQKTSSAGLVDTYTITYTDGAMATFTVTNASGAVWGNVAGTLSNQEDLSSALALKANESELIELSEYVHAYCPFPVGGVYISLSGVSPETLWSGTRWERIAEGRTLIGVDENDEDFNYSQISGGEKSVMLTIDEMPAHAHTYSRTQHGTRMGSTTATNGAHINSYSTQLTGDVGGGMPHNNLPPYLTCYFWSRVE